MKQSILKKYIAPAFSALVLMCSLAVFVMGRPVLFSWHPGEAIATALFFSPHSAAAAFQTVQHSTVEKPSLSHAQTEDENDLSSGFITELPDSLPPVPAPAPQTMPKGFGPITETQYGKGSGSCYLACGAGSLKNVTQLPREEVAAEIGQPLPFQIEKNSTEPQVLIMHTHATESYQMDDSLWYDPAYSARSTAYEENVTTVGAAICEELNKQGICTIQDTTFHDYPSYNGSYERSCHTVGQYLEAYPSIKIVLDIHRDAIEHDGARIKPVFTAADGKKAAQIMIICGADDGTMNMPNFKKNLRFAAALQNTLESQYPGLTRPVLFDYRKYNQRLTTGSLLIEVGGHANTLEEAVRSGHMIGKSLSSLLLSA